MILGKVYRGSGGYAEEEQGYHEIDLAGYPNCRDLHLSQLPDHERIQERKRGCKQILQHYWQGDERKPADQLSVSDSHGGEYGEKGPDNQEEGNIRTETS